VRFALEYPVAIAPIASYDLPEADSWPPCRAPWTLSPARAVLLVHDMQQYFLAPYAAHEAPLRAVLRNVRALRKACDHAGIPVIFSRQPGEQSRDERGLLWDLWGPGIVAEPHAEALWRDLDTRPGDTVLLKRRYSAFHGTELFELMHRLGRDQLMITGVYAHIGCLATATDAFMHGIQPFFLADATADFSREDHLFALRQVARTCGVVTTTSALVFALAWQHVRALAAELLECPESELGPDDDLGDLGLDSVRAMQLVERLLPDDHGHDYAVVTEARTVRMLASLLAPPNL
jgi:bifunctional isochorismate lyase/aryl carrier protein